MDLAFDGAYDVRAADVDGDGDMDVLGAANVADDVTWWENSLGDGSVWTEHLVDGGVNGAVSVHAGDIDGDGDMDVAGVAENADVVYWWQNSTGDGTAWTRRVITVRFDVIFLQVVVVQVPSGGFTKLL